METFKALVIVGISAFMLQMLLITINFIFKIYATSGILFIVAFVLLSIAGIWEIIKNE